MEIKLQFLRLAFSFWHHLAPRKNTPHCHLILSCLIALDSKFVQHFTSHTITILHRCSFLFLSVSVLGKKISCKWHILLFLSIFVFTYWFDWETERENGKEVERLFLHPLHSAWLVECSSSFYSIPCTHTLTQFTAAMQVNRCCCFTYSQRCKWGCILIFDHATLSIEHVSFHHGYSRTSSLLVHTHTHWLCCSAITFFFSIWFQFDRASGLLTMVHKNTCIHNVLSIWTS